MTNRQIDLRENQDGSFGASQVHDVWEEWRGRQARPDACVLTASRRRAIERVLRDHPVQHVRALVRYAYEANEPGPRFWRGENVEGRTYLDLDNLLRVGKVDGRVEMAVAWADAAEEPGRGRVEDPVRALQRRAPGERVRADAPVQPARGSRGGRGPRW